MLSQVPCAHKSVGLSLVALSPPTCASARRHLSWPGPGRGTRRSPGRGSNGLDRDRRGLMFGSRRKLVVVGKVRTYIHAYIHTCLHAHINTYMPTYLHTYRHTYIHNYTHIYTYIYTCIHTYIYTYTCAMHARELPRIWRSYMQCVTPPSLHPPGALHTPSDISNWLRQPIHCLGEITLHTPLRVPKQYMTHEVAHRTN